MDKFFTSYSDIFRPLDGGLRKKLRRERFSSFAASFSLRLREEESLSAYGSRPVMRTKRASSSRYAFLPDGSVPQGMRFRQYRT